MANCIFSPCTTTSATHHSSFSKMVGYSSRVKLPMNSGIMTPPTDNNVDGLEIPPLGQIILVICLAVFGILTVSGNFFVVFGIFRDRTLKTSANYFLASLAIADLAIGIFVIPLKGYIDIFNKSWTFGSMACNLWLVLSHMTSIASILGTTAIAYVRYLAVTKPFAFSQSNTKRPNITMKLSIVLVWFFSAALASPILFVSENGRRVETCQITNLNYLFYCSIFAFVFPSIFVVYLYVSILRTLRAFANRKTNRRKQYSKCQISKLIARSMEGEKSATVLCKTMFASGLGERQSIPNVSGIEEEETSILCRRETVTSGNGILMFSDVEEHAALSQTSSTAAAPQAPKRPPLKKKDSNTSCSQTNSKGDHCSLISTLSLGFMPGTSSSRKDSDIDLITIMSQLDQSEPTSGVRPSSVAKMRHRLRNSSLALKDRKSSIILVTILLLFFTCRCPSIFTIVVNWACQFYTFSAHKCQVPKSISVAFTWFALCNSAINPILYSLFNDELLKKFFKNFHCYKIFKQKNLSARQQPRQSQQ